MHGVAGSSRQQTANERVFCLFDPALTDHFECFRQAFSRDSRLTLDLHHSLEDLQRLNGHTYHKAIIYVNRKRCSAQDFGYLQAFVRSGAAIVAFHSTTASFSNQPRAIEVFGAKFIRHGPVRNFRVTSTSTDLALANVHAFEVQDELFRQYYSPGSNTLYSYTGRTVNEPVIWTKKFGDGITLGLSIGHTLETMQHPSVCSMIRGFFAAN